MLIERVKGGVSKFAAEVRKDGLVTKWVDDKFHAKTFDEERDENLIDAIAHRYDGRANGGKIRFLDAKGKKELRPSVVGVEVEPPVPSAVAVKEGEDRAYEERGKKIAELSNECDRLAEDVKTMAAQKAAIQSELSASQQHAEWVAEKLKEAEAENTKLKTDFADLSDKYLDACAELEKLKGV
jgi:hypothetical protein